MTVAELVEKLRTVPADAVIVFPDDDALYFCEVDYVDPERMERLDDGTFARIHPQDEDTAAVVVVLLQ